MQLIAIPSHCAAIDDVLHSRISVSSSSSPSDYGNSSEETPDIRDSIRRHLGISNVAGIWNISIHIYCIHFNDI